MRPEGKSSLKDCHIVSVIIPTIGRESLELCKEVLEKQTRPPDELVVVMDQERRGPSWARNQGIRRTGGDLIAFTDDDCVPPEDWLERLVEAIDVYKAAGAGGTYQETDLLLQEIRTRRAFPAEEQEDTLGFVGAGGNVMYRRDWLNRLANQDGYVFNESIRISQDIELSWRLRVLGAKLIYIPTRVVHLRHETPLSYFRLQFNRGIGISDLYKTFRSSASNMTVQKSLVWGQTEKSKRACNIGPDKAKRGNRPKFKPF